MAADNKPFLVLFRESVQESVYFVMWDLFLIALPFLAGGLAWAQEDPNPTHVYATTATGGVVAVLVTLWHAYWVWKPERTKALELEEQLRKADPKFVGFIDWMFIRVI